MIGPGSVVVATRDGGRDREGLPIDVPRAGHRYIVVDTYETPYGLGVELENMDPFPYRGYILHRRSKKAKPGGDKGWYFKEVDLTEQILQAAERALRND